MNRIMIEPGKAGFAPHYPSFDWRPNLDRLEAEAAGAAQRRTPDQWTLGEALCWMDLMDAELAALDAVPADTRIEHSRAQLLEWRGRVEAVIDTLEGLESRLGRSFARTGKAAPPGQATYATSHHEKNLHSYGTT